MTSTSSHRVSTIAGPKLNEYFPSEVGPVLRRMNKSSRIGGTERIARRLGQFEDRDGVFSGVTNTLVGHRASACLQ